MRRAIRGIVIAAVLAGTGCADPRTPGAQDLVEGEAPPSASYALLFDNFTGTYGNLDGLVWLIDDRGQVVAEKRGFKHLFMGGMRASGGGAYFVGRRASYRIDASGLATFSQPATDFRADVGMMVEVAEGRVLAAVDAGLSADGTFRTAIVDVSDPSRTRIIDGGLIDVNEMAVCSSGTYLLTTEGLTDGARWEDAATGEVLVTTPGGYTGGLLNDPVCKDDVIYSFDLLPSADPDVGFLQLSRGDTRDSFAGTSIPLVNEKGQPLIDDGSRSPVYEWIMDGQVVWTNNLGEVWGADLDTGVARVLATFPEPGEGVADLTWRGGASNRQGDTVVKAYQFADEIQIRRYSIPGLEVLDEVMVKQTPIRSDMSITGVAAVDF